MFVQIKFQTHLFLFNAKIKKVISIELHLALTNVILHIKFWLYLYDPMYFSEGDTCAAAIIFRPRLVKYEYWLHKCTTSKFTVNLYTVKTATNSLKYLVELVCSFHLELQLFKLTDWNKICLIAYNRSTVSDIHQLIRISFDYFSIWPYLKRKIEHGYKI